MIHHPPAALTTHELLELSAQIVSAYVSNNAVEKDELPDVIASVFEQVRVLSLTPQGKPENPDLVPAIDIDASVTDEAIYSLEDGQPYKSLKRHLKAKYGMSPEDYRQKWSLPPDYPMVAPAYARERSALARKSGLGRERKPMR